MSGKPKSARKVPERTTKRPEAPKAAFAPNSLANARWQRTVRYGWDKGGSKGGRR